MDVEMDIPYTECNIVHEHHMHTLIRETWTRGQSATGFDKYYKSDTLTDKTKTCMQCMFENEITLVNSK